MTTAINAGDVADALDDATDVCARCGDWPDTSPLPTTGGTGIRQDPIIGWRIGDGTLLCPACRVRGACETTGHLWGRWTTLGPSLDGRWKASHARHCRICTAGEFVRIA